MAEDEAVYFMAEVTIIENPGELHRLGSPKGKPLLRVQLLPGGPVLLVSTNLGEMIGGIARGAHQRWESGG